MGRPSPPLNTAGHIRFYTTSVSWRARCTYRGSDGTTREVERTGRRRTAPRADWNSAIRDRAHLHSAGGIAAETRVKDAAAAWLTLLEHQAQRSPRTIEAYRYQVNRQIAPAIGNLRLREVSVGVVERFFDGVATQHGASTAKMARSVLRG